jgi:hypothetical protein
MSDRFDMPSTPLMRDSIPHRAGAVAIDLARVRLDFHRCLPGNAEKIELSATQSDSLASPISDGAYATRRDFR